MLSITRCNSTKVPGTEGFSQIPRKSVLLRCNCPRQYVNLTSDIRNSDGSHTPLCRLRLGCMNLNQPPARKLRNRNASHVTVRPVRSFVVGRMLSAVSGRYTNTVAYTFDPVGRKASEALTISSVTYTIGQAYNARNELTAVTYPDSSTSTRSYHSTGALNELALDGSTISTRSYDAGRRQTTEVLGNGITS